MSQFKIASYNAMTGEITSIRTVPVNEAAFYAPYVEITDENIGRDTHYIDHGSLIAKSIKTSEYHEFDAASKQWVLPASANDDIKSRQQEAVKLQSGLSGNEPILFEGVLIDADQAARENIRNTIDRIMYETEQGIISINLFWIDANNNELTWANSLLYLAWLKRLHVAIANRKTNLVLTYKSEKDKIKAAAPADLLAGNLKDKDN